MPRDKAVAKRRDHGAKTGGKRYAAPWVLRVIGRRLRPAVASLGAGGPASRMVELLLNAISSGVLLGGFYAAVTVGIAISFGMLDIGNLAHPAFIIFGSFTAYILNSRFGIDPIVAGVLVLPGFLLLGALVYEIYYWSFERRGDEGLRGLTFFFGLLFIIEVALILIFGVDYRFVEAPYIGPSLHLGLIDLPLRMLVPFMVSVVMVSGLQIFLSRTFIGRAIL